MSWDNDHLPTVHYEAVDHYSDTANQIAMALQAAGMTDEANLVRKDVEKVSSNVRDAVHKTGVDTSNLIQDIIKDREYHSKSGYVGRGNLWRHVESQESDDGYSVDIFDKATSKNDYWYIQAFEFGLKNKDYPAHHPFHDGGEQGEEEFEKNMTQALEK